MKDLQRNYPLQLFRASTKSFALFNIQVPLLEGGRRAFEKFKKNLMRGTEKNNKSQQIVKEEEREFKY
jgi:hypothetical protein